MTATKRFLIIDDDAFSNVLSKMVLRKMLGDIEVVDFAIPELALEYIATDCIHKNPDEKTTLFLDINMPTLTGWEFLDQFQMFAEPVKNQFNIYMLSSSIDPADVQRAKLNPLVIDFIEKPLNKEILRKMLG